MIRLPQTIFVATAPLDLRLSFDRLAGIVRQLLGGDPKSDAIYVFHNRARTHLKMLWHDSTGYCVIYKRLDRGTYRIPDAIPHDAPRVQVSAREMTVLLAGIDEAKLRAARRSVLKSTRSKKRDGNPTAGPPPPSPAP